LYFCYIKNQLSASYCTHFSVGVVHNSHGYDIISFQKLPLLLSYQS